MPDEKSVPRELFDLRHAYFRKICGFSEEGGLCPSMTKSLKDFEIRAPKAGSDTSCQAIHIWRKGKSSHKISALGKGIFNTPGKVHHRNVCTKHRRGGFRIRPLLSRVPPNRARLNKQVVRQSSGFFRRGGGSPPASLFFYFHKRVGNRHPRCQRYPKAVVSAIRMPKCKCCYLEMPATNRQIFDRAVRICRKKILFFLF